MARGPTGAAGGSTIAQPVGAQTKPTVTQRALTAVRRLFFTAEDVKDPERLYQIIYQLSQGIVTALRSLAEFPVGGGNLLTGVVFTAGQTQYLQHGLGRPYRGFVPVEAATNPALFSYAAMPASATTGQVIPLTSANAGTYSIYIF